MELSELRLLFHSRAWGGARASSIEELFSFFSPVRGFLRKYPRLLEVNVNVNVQPPQYGG